MIRTINLELTTHCNKRCPNCATGIGINRTLKHHSWEYFEQAAVWLKGIHRIHLTGGEPTTHPKFAEFIPKFRRLFDCQELTMVTNGYRVLQHLDLISRELDYLNFSDYEDQGITLSVVSSRMKVHASHEGIDGSKFIPRLIQLNGKPCSRACWISNGCAYADGKFWGCCVAQSLPGATPLEPCENWQIKLLAAKLPCGSCFLSE